LSVKLNAYKGSVPKNILFVRHFISCSRSLNLRFKAILKKHRFDLPVGIEHNPANWSKVKKAVKNALTQLRSKFKKAVRQLGPFLYFPSRQTLRLVPA